MARFLSTQMAFVCLTSFLEYLFHYGLLPGTPRTGYWLSDRGVV